MELLQVILHCSACDQNITALNMQHRCLTLMHLFVGAGGVPGAEPLPFMGLPLLEPELHPSYVLRSVVLTSATSNQYAATEVCTRGALGEAVGKETLKIFITTNSKAH